jgi:hypothetical protein
LGPSFGIGRKKAHGNNLHQAITKPKYWKAKYNRKFFGSKNPTALTLYRSYDPYMGHKRFFHCHAEKVGT